MKLLNLTLPAVSFVLTAVGLEIDWQYIALVAGSAFAGSLVLGYLRREKTVGQQISKIFMATIVGLIFGAALVEYRGITSPAYVGVAYFASSLLALILIRTLVSLFEANAGSLTVTLVQRIFNVKLDKNGDEDRGSYPPRTARRRQAGKPVNDIHISHSPDPNAPPVVVIGENAKPDEIRVIEQTVVDAKKDGTKL